MYHILFNINENYIKYFTVTVNSLVLSIKETPVTRSEQLNIYILIDNISKTAQEKLLCFEKELNTFWPVKIYWHEIDDSWLEEYPKWKNSYVAYFRILFDKFLPDNAEKVLYLDCDTIVLKDIREIFRLNLHDSILGAVYEKQPYSLLSYDKKSSYEVNQYLSYFNSGVMIIDRKKWQQFEIETKIKEFLKIYNVRNPDQDALSAAVKDKVRLLPFKWNMKWSKSIHPDDRQIIAKNFAELSEEQEKWFYEGFEDPSIVHFSIMPWKSDGFHLSRKEKKPYYYPYIDLWWEIAEKTPVYSKELLAIRSSKKYKRMILSHNVLKKMLRFPCILPLLKLALDQYL